MSMSNSDLERLAQKYMQKLQISREEAYQLIADDDSTELTPEQKALTEKLKAWADIMKRQTKNEKKVLSNAK